MADAQPRILAVDDNEAKRYAVTRILRKAGFEVEEAASGGEALTRARSKPDLIVLDVKLPDMNGFEVCRRLKDDPDLASIPVLHLSASYTRASDRITGLESGADAYMVDPVEPAELVAMVNALLRARRAEEDARTTARQWQTTFDALRDGVCLVSRAGKILEANRALGELLGAPPEALRGRHLAHRFSEAFNAPAPALLDESTVSAEHVVEIDVSGRWLRLRRDPIRDSAGEMIGAAHVIADVTSEKRSDFAVRFLAEATAQLSSSLNLADILATTVRVAIPMLADFAAVDVAEPDGSIRRVAVASERAAAAAELEDVTRTPGEAMLSAIRGALSERRLHRFTAGPSTGALDLTFGIAIPLIAQDVTVGVLTLARGSTRPPGPTDEWLGEGFARAVGAALANARTHAAVREAERRAEEARALVDVVMENAPVGMAVFDRELRYVRVNASLATINGIGAEAHVGRTPAELLRDLGAPVTADLEAVLATGQPITRDLSGQTPGTRGELRHWFVSYYPLRAAGGDVFGVGALVADLTERRRVEDQLRFLADASRVLASTLDIETTLANIARLVVPALADWCAIDVDDGGALKRIAVAHVDPSKVQYAQELHQRYPPDPAAPRGVPLVMRTGESDWMAEIPSALLESLARDPEHLRIIRELGLRSYMAVPLLVHGAPFGAISFVIAESGRLYTETDLAFAEELTRRASLAVENARLYSEAQGAVRAREDVLAFVSHDLKNPLTSIVMNATLLRRSTPEGVPGDKLRRHIEMIVRAAERMNRLVHDLLDWASLRAGKLSLAVKDVDVLPMLNEISAILQPVAAMKEQTLRVEAPSDLTLSADRDRVMRVLSNLVGNALKYTPEKGLITVRAEQHPNEVVIAVQDTGPGIPEGEAVHVFDRYYRAKQAGAEGTGLGLAIAKGIVEAHGGRIWLDTKVGVGSTFAFALPRRRTTPTIPEHSAPAV